MSTSAPRNATRATAHSLPALTLPRRSGMALALLAAFGAHVPALAAPSVTPNNIVPNGKTNTVLTPGGAANTVDITTTTIKGNVGLNTFSTFEVGAGNTVNLHVPGAANMLLNVVYDSPILVNGIVNGYKDGSLGGKIAFADPHGMVVGASGVLNVGSLSVLTPRADFLAGMIDGAGNVNGDQLGTLLAGGAPLSANGLITIAGRINALDNISLRGALVDVNGVLAAGADVAHLAAFTGTVNTSGMPQAGGVVAHDGAIEIVAATSATVAGALEVSHGAGAAAGSVGITGTSVALENGARLTTQGANVVANGATITVANGAAIDAGAGNITLAAKSEDLRAGMGDRNAEATLTVNGSLKGAALGLSASARAETDNTGLTEASDRDALSAAGGALGFRWSETLVHAGAKVVVGAGAVLDASGRIDIAAASTQKDILTIVLGDNPNSTFNSVAIHTKVSGGAQASVESGAQLTTKDALSVTANNNNTLDAQAALMSWTAARGVTLAYAESDLNTAAAIKGGVVLNVAKGVDVVGRSTSDYAVQATSGMLGTGKAGMAAAISDMHDHSSATLAADVSTAGNVRVQAETLLTQNFNKSSTETGSGFIAKLAAKTRPTKFILSGLKSQGDLTTGLMTFATQQVDAANKKANASAGGAADTSTTVKLGAAFSMMNDDFSAKAAIAPAAKIDAGSGDALVLARIVDSQVHNMAQSSVNSATKAADATLDNPSAQLSASAGVALAFIKHDASATVGNGAAVDARHILVDSAVVMPFIQTWTQWDDIGEIATHLTSQLGLPETVLTSYANASGESTEGTLAGAVNWFDVGNSSRAWVGANAALTAKAGTGAATLTPQGSGAAALTLPASLTIRATTRLETVDVAGNVSATLLSGTGGGDGGTAVGGAFMGARYHSTTTAAVDDGARLTSQLGNLAVLAESDDKAVVLAPSTGGGASIGANGAGAYGYLDNTTTAALSKRAFINTAATEVRARESLSFWTVAGAVTRTSATSVGVGIAYNDMSATTQALIGDVAALRTAGDGAGTLAAGSVTSSGALTVAALTDGQANALSVAGAKTANADDTPDPAAPATDVTKATAKQAATSSGEATVKAPGKLAKAGAALTGLATKARDKYNAATADSRHQPEVQLSLAGSSSVNASSLNSYATIEQAQVQASALAVSAANNTDLVAASGSAAAVKAGATSVQQSAAVAAALAVNNENNKTRALATDSVFNRLESASVDAWTAGQHIAVGVGVAKNSQSGPDSASAVGSASIVLAQNTTEAGASGSDFTFDKDGKLRVLAYDRTDVGAGGGALSTGGFAGVGVAVTYTDVGNTARAHLDGATVRNAADVTVAALQPTRIIAGALQAASTDGSLAVSASVAIANIHNTTSASIDDSAAKASDIAAASVDVVATDSPAKAGLSAFVAGANTAATAHTDTLLFDFNQKIVDDIAGPPGSTILTAAGAFGSGKSALGAALTYNEIGNHTSASATGKLTTTALSVRAADWSSVASIAAGVAMGKTGAATGVGSATVTEIDNTTEAALGRAGTTTTVSAPGADPASIAVTAAASGSIRSLAGSLSKSDGNSVGAAFAFNDNGSATTARIASATLAAGKVDVTATNAAGIQALAAGVAYSGESNALGGSYTQNETTADTGATVSDVALNAGAPNSSALVTVKAANTASIEALAGGGAVALKGSAAGAGVSLNRIAQTTHASLLGGDLQAGSVLVQATAAAAIRSIAVGAALSAGDLGVGGSSAINISNNETLASIDQGAHVVARNNVGVVASGSNAVSTFAGAAGISFSGTGVGLATTVNLLTDKTSALVGGNGATTSVTALGETASDELTVNNGELDHPESVLSGLGSAATLKQITLKEGTRGVTGLAVNASSLTSLATMSLSVGAGSKNGLAGNFATSVLGGASTASITGARINQDATRSLGSGSDVDVRASTHGASASLTGSVGIAGGSAAGIAVDTEQWSGATTAGIVDSSVNAGGALAIDARQSVAIGALGAGIALGMDGGGAGTGLIVNLAGATTAQLAGGSTSADSLAVKANSGEAVTLIGGAIGAGGSVGLGGVYAVIDSKQDTRATIGAPGRNTTVAATNGGVTVDAATLVDNHLYAAAVGGSVEAGAGLTVGVMLDENTTAARVVNTDLSASGALAVKASERDKSEQAIGALGVGITGAGFGASIAVTDNRAQVTAQISGSSTDSRGVTVSAGNDQQIESTAISLGAGFAAGVGGAVSLVQLGSGGGDGGAGVLGQAGALGNVNAMLGGSNNGNTGSLSSAEATALRGSAIAIAPDSLLQAGARNSAGAAIEASRVSSTGDVKVDAISKSSIANTAGGAAVGAGAVGGGAAVSAMYNQTRAGIDAASTVTATDGGLYLNASSGNGSATDGISGRAYGGAAGAVGIGAAVGLAHIDNQVSASAGGLLKADTGLAVSATDTTSIDVQAASVALGALGAVGVTFVEAEKTGAVLAAMQPAAGATQQRVTAPSVLIGAASSGEVDADAKAGVAGIGLAAGANHALAKDSVSVGAAIGAGARIDAVDVAVLAARTPQVQASSAGVGVAGSVQVGMSEAQALVGGATTAAVGDDAALGFYDTGAGLASGALTVRAQQLVAGGQASADAKAFAAGGGLLAGLNGALARAGNTAQVTASVGDRVVLPLGDVLIDATGDSAQNAVASGVTIGGLLAAGADVAYATSNIDTAATLGAGATSLSSTVARPGALSVLAHGADNNRADARSGAGGLVAGAAALASTSTSGSTIAAIAPRAASNAATGTVLRAGEVTIDSSHSASFLATSDASLGAVVGGSGANSDNKVDFTVAATVGSGVNLDAADFALSALNKAVQASATNNASGISGGLVAGAGISSTNTINTATRATVGANAALTVSGDPLDAPGDLRISAGNIVASADNTSVETGGLFAGVSASSQSTVTSTNEVTIGAGAALDSVGDLDLGTWSQANVSNNAYVHAYGLAAGAGGNAASTIALTQNVDIGANAKLNSWGNLTVASGRAPGAASFNSLQARATNQVYADGAITGASPKARATIASNGNVTVQGGAQLTSVRDIALSSLAGSVSANATGEGHYRVLGVPVTNSNAAVSTPGTQSVTMDGSALAGTRHAVGLSIDALGNVSSNKVAWQAKPGYDPVRQLTDQVNALGSLKAAAADPVVKADIDAQIVALNGLITTLNGRGLYAGTPVNAIEIGNTLAAGGNIDINAGTFGGHGKLDAWGGPTITLNNDSSRFLVVDKLFIPNELGGNIRIRAADRQAAQPAAVEHGANAAASISINNNFDSSVPRPASDPDARAPAPAIFLTSNVENVGGALSIFNKSGDLGQFGAVSVNSETILVPNGAYIVNTPNSPYFLNGDPQGQYYSPSTGLVYDLTPGLWLGAGTPGVALPGGANPLSTPSTMTEYGQRQGGVGTPGSPEEAVTYVANYVARSRGYTGTTTAELTAFLMGGAGHTPRDGVSGGISTMFFYSGSAYADCGPCYGQSSPAYQSLYGPDYGFYYGKHPRFNYPSVAQRTLTNSIASLTPGTAAPAANVSRVGTTAIINAAIIDINGTIKVGLASDLSANIAPQTIKVGVDKQGMAVMRDLIDCINDSACRPQAAGLQQANGLYRYSAAPNGSDTPVDVYYNADTRQLALQKVSAGGSGAISLRGQIINTNASGSNIEVSNGYAHVTVNNTTGASLLTSDINTGDGNVGLVKITDTAKRDTSGQPLTTWYVNRLGLGMSTYQSSTASDYAGLSAVATSATAQAQYKPTEGIRYYWQYDANLTRQFTPGVGEWANTRSEAWMWTPLATNAASSYGGVWQVTNGLTVRTNLKNTQFHEEISGSASSQPYAWGYTYNYPWAWTWDIVTGVHITANISVKADNAIGIKFTGNNSAGLVDIASNASVVIGGAIRNSGGATNIKAIGASATISANANGAINTQSIDLQAGAGIGSLADPLTVNLVKPFGSDGSTNLVTAITAGGDIGLALKGEPALIRKVDAGAGGDVLLQADADLSNAPGISGAVVTGRNLTINSIGGAVGGATNPLAIQAISSVSKAGALTGGIVNASGRDGVSLRQVDGDLYIGHVTSPGDVKLVAAGNVLDGRDIATTNRDAELAALWETMHLRSGSGDTSAVTAYQNGIVAQYGSYKSLLALNSASDGGFALNAAGVALLQRQADADKGGNIAATPEEVKNFALRRYTALRDALAAAQVTDFSLAADKFTFTASAANIAKLVRGQYWTDEDLLYQVNAAALAPAGSALVSVPDAGITGARVTLASTGKDIGSLAAPVHFDMQSDGTFGNLSAAQKAALASATSAGDLVDQTYVRIDGSSEACQAVSAACRLTSFNILRTEPLTVDVKAGLTASADQGSIYLAAKGALPIASVRAQGDVRISSESGMSKANTTSASTNASAIDAGARLVLQNGSGSIGAADNYMTVKAGNLITARSGDNASGDLYLQALAGDLAFDNLFATSTVALKTSDAGAGDIVGANSTGLASIAARTLLLDASGSVYQAVNGRGRALQVQLADGAAAGTLGGTVRGTLDIANAASLRLAGLDTVGRANITANKGNLQVSSVSGPDLALFATNGKIAGTGGGVNIDSAGTVTLNGGSTNAAYAHGAGIGMSAGDRLTVRTRLLDATTGTGDMWISLAGGQGDTSVLAAANAGSTFDLSAGTDFTATRITSAKGKDSGTDADTGGDIHLSTTGTAVATLANIDAGRDLYLDSVDGQFRSADGASVQVARDLRLTMTGNGTMNDDATTSGGLSAGRDIVMNAAALDLGALDAVRNIDLTARSGDLAYRKLASGGAVLADAAGAIRGKTGGALSAHGDARLDGTSITLNDTTVGNDAWLTVNGGALGVDGAVAIARDLHLGSTGANTLAGPLGATLGAGRDLLVDAAALADIEAAAGRDLHLNARSGAIGYTRLAAQRSVLATASGAIGAASGATILAGADVTLAGATLAIGDITAGEHLQLTSSGTLSGTGAMQAGSFAIGAGADARMHALSAGGAGSIRSGAALALDTVVTGGALQLNAGGAIDVADVQAGGDLQAAGMALDLAAAQVRGDAVLMADSRLHVGQASVGGDATLNAGTMQLGAIDSEGSLSASAGTNLAYTTLTAKRDLRLSAGDALTGAQGSLLQAGGKAGVSAASLLVHDLSAGDAASLASTRGDLVATGTVAASSFAIDAAADARLHALQAAENGVVRTGGKLAIDQARTGANLTLRSAGAATLDGADVGGDFDAAGASLALAAARVGGAASLVSTRGDIDLTDTVAASSFAIDAAADARLHALHAANNGVVNTGGKLAVGQATSGADLTVRAAGEATLDSADVGGNLDATGASLALAAARVDGRAALTSTAGMSLGAIEAGALHATAGTNLDYATLMARRDVQLDASGNIAGASVESATVAIDAGADARLQTLQTGGDGLVHAGAALAIDQAAVGGSATLSADTMTLGAIDAGAKLAASAGRSLTFTTLRAGEDLDLVAGATIAGNPGSLLQAGARVRTTARSQQLGDVTAAGQADLSSSGDLVASGTVRADGVLATAGGKLVLQTVDSGADARLRAGGLVQVDTADVRGAIDTASAALDLGTVRVAGKALLATSGAMRLAALTVGGKVDAGAGTRLAVGTLQGGTDVALRGADLALGAVRAANDLALSASAGAQLGDSATGRDLTVDAGGALSAASGTTQLAGRDIRIDAAQVRLGALQAGRDATVTAATSIAADALAAERNLVLTAGTTLASGTLRAGEQLQMNAVQGIDIGAMWAANLGATTPGVLRIGDLALGSTASVAAREIDIGVRQAGTQGLTLTAAGYQGGVADTVALRVAAPAGLTLPTLRARMAQVTSTAHMNRIDRGYITGSLRLATPEGVMLMNNTSAASLAGADIQLHAPDHAFMLSQAGSQYFTDAYVIQYAGDARPTVPNYQDSHRDSPVPVYGASAARDAGRVAGTNLAQAGVAGANQAAQLALLATPAPVHAGAAVVNLGEQDGAAREQDLDIDTELKLN